MKQKWSLCMTAVIITSQQPQASHHHGLVFSVWMERPETQQITCLKKATLDVIDALICFL